MKKGFRAEEYNILLIDKILELLDTSYIKSVVHPLLGWQKIFPNSDSNLCKINLRSEILHLILLAKFAFI